jgi:hypothetical protein
MEVVSLRKFVILMTAIALVAFAAVALAASGKMKAMPGVYDPDKTKSVDASWQAKAGLPDAGNSNHGLVLVKSSPTPTNAAAGASLTGAEGEVVQSGASFGWDYKTGTYCGAGAPRMNLEATDGFHFLGGCANGTQSATPGATGWNRVRIDPTNPAQAFPVVAPGATIISVTLIQDEQGSALVDNILVNNNSPIQKPGNN